MAPHRTGWSQWARIGERVAHVDGEDLLVYGCGSARSVRPTADRRTTRGWATDVVAPAHADDTHPGSPSSARDHINSEAENTCGALILDTSVREIVVDIT